MDAVIIKFDQYLARRGLKFDAIIIGGAALVAMGVIDRTTRDMDCLFPDIPGEIKQASRDFAKDNADFDLIDDWLNNGPASLTKDLPDDWRDRLISIFSGRALVLRTLGRIDLLRTKLFALCDRQEDLPDCIALAPTAKELDTCLPWVVDRDGNRYWPEHVKNSFAALAEKIGYVYNPPV